MKFQKSLVGSAFAAMLISAPASANVLINGSFEDPHVTSNWYENFTGSLITGWTIANGQNVDIVNTSVGGSPWTATASDGKQFLDLVGFGTTGEISQTFATTPGTQYRVSFAYGDNPGSGSSNLSANVTVFGTTNLITASFSTTSNIGWQIFSQLFTANSLTTTIDFSEVFGASNGGILLDAVNVSSTPLPATWIMLLGGLLAFGGLAYRRPRMHAPASMTA